MNLRLLQVRSRQRAPQRGPTGLIKIWFCFFICMQACLCVFIFIFFSSCGNNSYASHTHCFAKLMDLLECIHWAWKQLWEWERKCACVCARKNKVWDTMNKNWEQRGINKSLCCAKHWAMSRSFKLVNTLKMSSNLVRNERKKNEKQRERYRCVGHVFSSLPTRSKENCLHFCFSQKYFLHVKKKKKKNTATHRVLASYWQWSSFLF